MSEEEKNESFFDEKAEPKIVVIPAGGVPAAPPLTLKTVAWKFLWAFVFFVLIVIVASLLIVWLWNENLAGVTGLSEIDLRTAASGVILFRLASFLWRM